ncbi:lipopolysaccharide biosynthesis protein [Paenibacillus sp. FSL R10-2734]|uniref:lipopolysaccharide biosynthesis protein n=1 Tax=Paenibacillus sp. FSL R10-2734 TaxID=2954691 RepID=UPI0030D8175A
MNGNSLNGKIISATKWSSITEVVSKLVTPITQMILARMIAPEEFGIIATVTMVVSFVDMFTDAGFQKYLIQHQFKDEEEKHRFANVAFLTNLAISLLLWTLIIIFSNEVAILVGNAGLGNVIAIACIQLPITAFSSIQMALYKRDFNFRILFKVRMVTILIPLLVSIPLALLGFSFWSLIIGTITMQFLNSIILTISSNWKPTLYFEKNVLKEMLSFSLWSLMESVSIWLTTWIDVFIIGSLVSQYYLGIYKNSLSIVNALMALVTSSIIPVLFSVLSRLQNDDKQFLEVFLKVQKIVAILIIPLGTVVYLYSDFITLVLLGENWIEAKDIIGNWALTSAIMVVLSNLCSEVYRAKGRPKLSLFAQLSHLIVLIPVCLISSHYGFWTLVYTRSWVRLELVIVNMFLMRLVIGIPVLKILKNVGPPIVSALFMGIFKFFIEGLFFGFAGIIISILFCFLVYFVILILFPSVRSDFKIYLKLLKVRLHH